MIINVNSVNKLGFIDFDIDPKLDLIAEIKRLKQEKKATILAHYYQTPEVQDIADFVGDSLALSQKVVDINSDIIVFAGVKFMAETTKILSPDKKVILPDLNAGCSLADSCNYKEFKEFLKDYPNHTVVTYVNTTAEIKSLSHICCTSSNAIKIVNSVPREKGVVFAPDKNLGNYIKSLTDRENMVIWNGACHVHEEFSVEAITELNRKYPNAKVIAHPECKKPVLILADFIGSTAQLLQFTKEDSCKEYIVATESGIIHQMKKSNPEKKFLSPPPVATNCGCSECNFMKMITLKKIYLSLKYELPVIELDKELMDKARLPILKMLEISK